MVQKIDKVLFTSFTKTVHHDTYPDIDPTRISAAGKHVVITGGGTGIGKAVAIGFAQAGAASIGIISRRREVLEKAAKEIEAAGKSTKVVFAAADATDGASLDAAFKSITDQTGGVVEVAVVNAGALPSPAPVAEADLSTLRYGVEMNLISSFVTFRAFLPYAAKDAIVLNTTSGIGHIDPGIVPGSFQYAVAKAANIKLFDYIGFEHPDFTVVNVQPGVIATDINAGIHDAGIDTLELPGHFYVWLASAEARFLNRRTVWVNWDVNELIARKAEIEADPNLLRVNLSGVPM